MTDILVDPTDRFRAFVVFANVANELGREILCGSEDASRNNISLNLGKPNFDLLEPAEVGRGGVDPNSGVGRKKFTKFLCLFRTQVVCNDVDLVTCWLTPHDLGEEIDEVRAGVKCTGFRQRLFGVIVQSVVERKSSIGAAGRRWEHRVEAIHPLHGALLGDAEYSGVYRGV